MPARTYAAAMAMNLDPHPYPKPREIVGTVTICEVCNDRKIPTKDWAAHKNSKAHRKIEEEIRNTEEGIRGRQTEKAVANGDGWADPDSAAPAAAWTDSSIGNGNDGFSIQPARKFGGAFPKSAGAGGRGCFNCGETGHNKAECPNPRQGGGGGGGGGGACYGCGEVGHNKADCPNPRQGGGGGGGGGACYGCGEVGHNKADCPNPRQGGGGGGSDRACFNCGQTGHSKSDCTNERVLTCRNCDAVGHVGKDCDQPKDWSRVKCNNCDQMGHTVKRCKEPIKEEADDWGSGGDGGWGAPAEPAGDWANADGANADGGGGETTDWGDASADAGGGW